MSAFFYKLIPALTTPPGWFLCIAAQSALADVNVVSVRGEVITMVVDPEWRDLNFRWWSVARNSEGLRGPVVGNDARNPLCSRLNGVPSFLPD
jgi:hypothetical protein